MLREVFIRCDGSVELGLGHIVRCIALAHMIKNDFKIFFFSVTIPESLRDEITSSGFEFLRVKDEENFFSQVNETTIVVLDGYSFDSAYQKRIKLLGAKLVCIDDMRQGQFFADLIINHSPGVRDKDYLAMTYTRFALGPDFALLRPPFLEQASRNREITSIENVLICFGGSDYLNLTAKTLKTVSEFKSLKNIFVVTGPAYCEQESLDSLLRNDQRIHYFQNLDADALLRIMSNVDLAIVPASGILFETLAVGLIVLSGYYVENQKSIYLGFKDLGCICGGENFKDIKGILNLTFNTQAIKPRKKVIDGLSGERIVKEFRLMIN